MIYTKSRITFAKKRVMLFKQKVKQEVQNLFHIQQNNRAWAIPFLAALCVGTPIIVGYLVDHLQYGVYACISGLVIAYLPHKGSLTHRMINVLISSFGFMFSMTIGLIFSFNPIVASLVFGLFSFAVHWVTLYYKTSPPGSFFFILIASMAITTPFTPAEIPLRAGLIGLSTMFTCIVALSYTLFVIYKENNEGTRQAPKMIVKNSFANSMEAIIMGVFMFLSLFIGYLLDFDKPYWISISCSAVMLGASLYHIRQRTIHRILGTFIGMGLSWLILSYVKSELSICIAIILLQFIIEVLITRQYALAVIFITPFTILLSEAASSGLQDPNELIQLRLIEIVIGSILGAIGGWFLYKEKIRYHAIRGLQKISLSVKRK